MSNVMLNMISSEWRPCSLLPVGPCGPCGPWEPWVIQSPFSHSVANADRYALGSSTELSTASWNRPGHQYLYHHSMIYYRLSSSTSLWKAVIRVMSYDHFRFRDRSGWEGCGQVVTIPPAPLLYAWAEPLAGEWGQEMTGAQRNQQNPGTRSKNTWVNFESLLVTGRMSVTDNASIYTFIYRSCKIRILIANRIAGHGASKSLSSWRWSASLLSRGSSRTFHPIYSLILNSTLHPISALLLQY